MDKMKFINMMHKNHNKWKFLMKLKTMIKIIKVLKLLMNSKTLTKAIKEYKI